MINCQRCKKQFIDEEFDSHECSPMATKAQEIGIDYMLEGEINENRDMEYIAKGLNGIIYRLVECHHNPTHTNADPTFFDSLEARRRLDRTSFYQVSS